MRLGLAIVPLLVLQGCLERGSNDSSPPGGGNGGARVEMVVSAADRDLAPGESTELSAEATNRGSQAFSYDHPGCPPGTIHFFAFVEGEEHPLPGEEIAGACVVTRRTIAPGESVTERQDWNGTVDGSRLPEGTYTIVARLNAVAPPYVVEEQTNVTIRVGS